MGDPARKKLHTTYALLFSFLGGFSVFCGRRAGLGGGAAAVAAEGFHRRPAQGASHPLADVLGDHAEEAFTSQFVLAPQHHRRFFGVLLQAYHTILLARAAQFRNFHHTRLFFSFLYPYLGRIFVGNLPLFGMLLLALLPSPRLLQRLLQPT